MKIKVKALVPLIDRGVYTPVGEAAELDRTQEQIDLALSQGLYELIDDAPAQQDGAANG